VIPQGFIQDLLARVDLVDVVGRHVQLKKAGQNFLGLCPFHGEKSPSFTVSPGKQFFHCFGCGAHGTAIGFLMEHRGLGFVDAVRELAQQAGMKVPEGPAEAGQAAGRVKALTDLMQRASDFYRQCLKGSDSAIRYLKGRGLRGKTAARFALGFSPDEWTALAAVFDAYDDAQLVEAGLVIANEGKRYDRFRGRLMFPIRNRRGWVIGFGARSLDGSEPKYLNSPETPLFHKGRELYGLFEAQEAIRRQRRVIVCEGYLDVIQLAQAGFEETVAALGTAVTSHHVGELLRLSGQVIFAFDGDAAGRKAARRALEAALPVIADTKRASFLLLPEGEDPDSLIKVHGKQGFEGELEHALPLSQFFVRALSGGSSLGTAEDRAALVAAAKPLLLSMAPGAMRAQLLRELADAARLPADEVASMFGLRRAAPSRPGPMARRTRHMDVDDLKRRVLQQLLVHPQLAAEFLDMVTEEHGAGEDPADREILEVANASVGQSPGAASALSHGALMELLAGSEHANAYRALAAQEMELETDVETARQILAEAFGKMRLRRLERVRSERLNVYQQDLSPEALEAYRLADQAYLRARSQAPVNPQR
jgi:DNA primase